MFLCQAGNNSESGSRYKEDCENNNKWEVTAHHASVRFMSVYPALLLSFTWRPRLCSGPVRNHDADEKESVVSNPRAQSEGGERRWTHTHSAMGNDNLKQP